jgi:putative ABC transport system permease protein
VSGRTRSWIARARRAWSRRPAAPPDLDEIDEEVRFHLAEEERLRVERGMTPAAARVSARRDFGNVLLVREVTRDMWGRRLLDNLGQDLRFAWRQLHRSRGFALVTVGTLALAIGATTALFTVVDGVLLRPLPFPDPDRLVMVFERSPRGNAANSVSPGNYLDWRDRARSFEHLALVQQLPTNVLGPEGAEQVFGLRVSAELFDALGVGPFLGRTPRRADGAPGAPPSVVLGHDLWQRRYGGQARVIGQQVSINGTPSEVLGVMPPGFAVPGLRGELFLVLRLQRDSTRGGRSFVTVARLRRDVPLERAQAEMSAIAARLAEEDPAYNARWGATVVRLQDHATGSVRRALLVLLGAVLCVLLIACANIACLLGMRASARAREMNVRVALGAPRWRLVHQLAVECLVLAGAGGALGLLIAHAGVPAILSLFPASFPLPRAQEVAVDARVLAVTAALSIGVGLVLGILPAWQAGRGRMAELLRAGGRALTGGARTRSALVVVEVTLAVVLVIGAGLLGRSLAHLQATDPGFQPERVLTAQMLLVPARYEDEARRASVVEQILERVRAVPGVSAAGSIHFLPLSGIHSGTGAHRLDRPVPAHGEDPGAGVSVITPGYLTAMGIPLIAGRDFDARDRLGAPRVALVNEALVRDFYPGEDPLGKRLFVEWCDGDEDCRHEIVGVVGDVRHGGLQQAAERTVFLSNAQAPSFVASLVVRTSGDPAFAAAAVREQVRRVDPEQGLLSVRPMEGVVADSIARPRLQALLLGGFAALALAMACLGLYGALAYSVEQRRREVGVRVAIGATPRRILRLVVGEGLRMTAVGLAIGAALALGLARYVSALLFGVTPTDPAVYAGVGTLLLAVAVVASCAPARRAMRVDPVVALREE